MKARSKLLCEHSVGMALSAIEVYNKPDFKKREQVFAILMVAAWETLLKAKILKDANNKQQSLWLPQERRPTGSASRPVPMTIGLTEALGRLQLPPKVAENIRCMAEIRNAAVHLMSDSKALPRLVFGLGVATLHNYSRLTRSWFDVSLSDFNFYILPLGFTYPFRTFTATEGKREPDDVLRLLHAVSAMQGGAQPDEDEFEFICEIKVMLASAKKLADEPDVVAAIGGEGDAVSTVVRVVNPLDKYPFSFRDMEARVKEAVPYVKQSAIHGVLRTENMRGDPAYSAYQYRNKKDEKKGPEKAASIIYNADAVQRIITALSSTQP